jgi:hypothetical protein
MYPMGYYFTRQKGLSDITYTIGFTSYKGRYGRIYVEPLYVNKPKKNSFEAWVRSLKYDYAFTDLKALDNTNKEFNQPFFMKGIGHFNIKADWTKAYDGIFYINEMFPCTKE